ncbi:hypothetical protein [Gordonia malaquae]|uniref:hypothetical protein n=1 Tax=Gordonia malaquae TaxID=410332 RepID=UPI0030FE5714
MSTATTDEVFEAGREFASAVLARPGLDRAEISARVASVFGHLADGRLDLARRAARSGLTTTELQENPANVR